MIIIFKWGRVLFFCFYFVSFFFGGGGGAGTCTLEGRGGGKERWGLFVVVVVDHKMEPIRRNITGYRQEME